MSYSLSDFDYDLPDDYIAQEPAEPRDHAGLLVYDRSVGSITDDYFYNILDYLPSDTTLVMNNSKVEKCRLLFDNKEVFVLESLDEYRVRAMVRPGKKFKEGREVVLWEPGEVDNPSSQVDPSDFDDYSSGKTDPDQHADDSSMHNGVRDIDNQTDRQAEGREGSDSPGKYSNSVDTGNNNQLSGSASSPDESAETTPSGDKSGGAAQGRVPITARVDSIEEDGIRRLTLSHPVDDPALYEFRYTPFPPYLQQDESLSDQYQTVFAKSRGSRAAPTAGLHFTEDLLKKIDRSPVARTEITLHVGLGTFAPVKTENIDDHEMHSEWFRISRETADRLNAADHITAVGTTSVRVLETCLREHEEFEPMSRETDIFIRPGFTFKAADTLITNFHLPKSTLLMLVAAFMGYEEMRRVYAHAIRENYRFYSFGDAMLIL